MNNTEATTKKNNRLKIVTAMLFVSVILLVSNSFAQGFSLGENDKLYIGSYNAVPGQDVPVQVFVTNEEPISSLSVPLKYDPSVLTLKSINFSGSRIEYISNKIVTPSDANQTNGHFMVGMFVVFEDALPVGDGLAFTAVFGVSDSAANGAVSVIDTLFYPPAGELIFVSDATSGVINPNFEAGTINISSSNRSPLFSNLNDQQIFEGDSLTFDINAVDYDNDNLVIACSDLPVGAVFTDNQDGTAKFSWQPGFVGPYSSDGSPFEINLWVSDGNLSREETLVINVVNKNRKPEITTVQTIEAVSGQKVGFNVSADDPDFETIVWQTKNFPTTATFISGEPGLFEWSSTLSDTGNFEISFIARDPQGYSDTALVNIHLASAAIYTLSMPTVSAYPAERVDLDINLNNLLPVGSFNLLVHYDPTVLTVVGVSNENTRTSEFDAFNFIVDENGNQGYLRITGTRSFVDSHLLEIGDGSIATIDFLLNGSIEFNGISAPIRFMFDDIINFDDNTLTDTVGVKIENNAIDYFDGSVDFMELGPIIIGDLNLNRIAYDIGDAIYFSNHFMNPFTFPLDPLQLANSDINGDNIGGTIADLVAIIRVITQGSSQYGKLVAEYTEPAEFTAVNGERMQRIEYNSSFEIGAVLLTIEDNGSVDLGKIIGFDKNMTYKIARVDQSIRVLVFSLDGNHLPSGEQTLLTIDNDSDIEISQLTVATSKGFMAESSVESKTVIMPESFSLYQNYPNPFNPETNISFDLPHSDEISLTVYNVLGEKVKVLIDENMPAGRHTIVWDSRNDSGEKVSSGIYFYRLETSKQYLNKKMLLLK